MANKIVVWVLGIFLAIAIIAGGYFCVKYKRALNKYDMELNDPYRLYAIDSINKAITVEAQRKIDSMATVIAVTQKGIDSIAELNNKINEKYGDIYKGIESAHANGDDIIMAYKLLAINRKISLERK